MFTLKFKKTEPTDLENEIARLFKILKDCVPGTARYNEVSDQIAKLYKLKEIDSKSAVSKDAMVGAATNLAGILMVLHYEQLHVITSKAALGMVKKIF